MLNVQGGSPNKCVNDACLADGWSFTGNGQGFWLFTRDQIANPDMILAMMSHAQKLGLDISSLKPVIQERCLYL